MNEDRPTDASTDNEDAAKEQEVIYGVISDELFFLSGQDVRRISEVQRLLAGGGAYSALIDAIFPLDPRVAELLQGLLEGEEEELEGDQEAGSAYLAFDHAKLDAQLQEWGQQLFDVGSDGVLPAEIEERFGRRVVGDSPVWSGQYLSYPAAEEAAIVQALSERGVRVKRDDSAVMSCLEG